MKNIRYSIGKGEHEIVLATDCEECDGEGRDCSNCDGLGGVITADGAQILSLVNDILLKGRKAK